MKRLALALLIILALASTVLAAPFLVCDPQTGVEYYTVSGLPAAINTSHILPDATGTYGFKLDLATLVPGTYTVKANACTALWGCSADSNPLNFVRPASGTGPLNLRLSP